MIDGSEGRSELRSEAEPAELPNPHTARKPSFVKTFALGSAATIFWLATKLFRGTKKTHSYQVPRRPAAASPSLLTGTAASLEAPRGGGGGRLLEAEPLSHEQIGTFLVVVAFLAAFAAGIAFVVLYWTGGSNALLGCTLACCCGGLGAVLVLWSHLLTIKREVVELREPLEPAKQERESAKVDFQKATNQIHRRGLLKWMIAGASGLVAAVAVSMFRSLGTSPDESLYSTIWKRGQRLMTLEGKPMTVDALNSGSMAIVFPEDKIGSERAQTVLIRVDKSQLELPSDRSDWAPEGNLAYSRVCTHAGCPVGMYETTTHLLMCPCHQSTFDVLRAAEPTGGPAARALPQLPLYVDSDGVLRAGGGLSDVPGPGFWGMP